VTDGAVIGVLLSLAAIIGIVVIVGGQIKDSEDRRILRESAQNAEEGSEQD
jgi:hypothetical protein